MRERYALWPAGRSARVEHECDIARSRELELPRGPGCTPGREVNVAFLIDIGFDDERIRTGGAPGFVKTGRRKDQRAGPRVLEVKAKFLLLVSWIERRGGSGDRGGKERGNHLDPVR